MSETEASYWRMGLFLGGLLVFILLEIIIPYRPSTSSKFKRWLINLGMTAFNRVALTLIFSSAAIQTASYVTRNGIGVLNLAVLPGWLKVLATLVFMDFMLYVWHLLNHEMPFLWRFHRVHHTDPNMDVSTATRFHLGELAVSSVIRVSLIFFLGADLLGILVFESALLLCAQFHHSSLRVPIWFERIFWVLFVPPSMHRIHHSVVIKERDANYGTIFSIWDRALGTMRDDVDQARIRIGVGAYPYEKKLGLGRLLVMPFTKSVR